MSERHCENTVVGFCLLVFLSLGLFSMRYAGAITIISMSTLTILYWDFGERKSNKPYRSCGMQITCTY